MKKFIMALAIATVTLSSFTAAAKDDKKDCPKAKECTEQQCDNKQGCPFEGLNLSDAQMQQIKQLQETRKTEMQKARQEAKQAKADAKKDKTINRQQIKRDELAQIKGILTPEQYVQYLENLVVNGQKAGMNPQRQGGDRKVQGPKGQQGKQRPNGQRPDRKANEAKAE